MFYTQFEHIKFLNIFFTLKKTFDIQGCIVFFFFFFFTLYLFIFGCVGSSLLCMGFLWLWQVGAALHRRVRASHRRGLSCCGAQAPNAQAQYLWLTGPVAPRHVGSSQTRARTRFPLHWQADSQPLRHQGSPGLYSFIICCRIIWVCSSSRH